jgi:hypothetical protein
MLEFEGLSGVHTANRRCISLGGNSSFGLERWIWEKSVRNSKRPKLLDLIEGCSAIF